MSKRPLALYNPRDVDPEQLDALLTGRKVLLDEILDNLRQQAGGKTRQHWLLRGQRGIGKTHLAGVIHHRVNNDPELSKAYLCLWLGEADVYEVYSAGKLLEKVAERLAEQVDASLLERIRGIEGTGDDDRLFEGLDELLSSEATRRHQVLLVLMENLDALLESFAPKERKAQTRRFRSLLLHNPHFLFISTTPTHYLKGLEDPKEPLYAHLKQRDLDYLTEEEVGELFQRLAGQADRKDLQELFSNPEGRVRLHVIHRLTGGLPRSVAMAFAVVHDEASLRSLLDEMRSLLDTQTAYFEARLSRLATRERAIVTQMALAPRNLTMQQIAQQTRLAERALPTHMARLEQDGHIRPISRSGGKGTVYELSEGLFRLWYQYRKGRMVLEPLVDFLAGWYRVEKLESVAQQLRASIDGEGSERRSTEITLTQIEKAQDVMARTELLQSLMWGWDGEIARARAATSEWIRLATRRERPAASFVSFAGRAGLSLWIKVFGLEQTQIWFNEMERASLDPVSMGLIGNYNMVLNILVADREEQGSPENREQRRHRELARIPQELRQTVAEMVESISPLHPPKDAPSPRGPGTPS